MARRERAVQMPSVEVECARVLVGALPTQHDPQTARGYRSNSERKPEPESRASDLTIVCDQATHDDPDGYGAIDFRRPDMSPCIGQVVAARGAMLAKMIGDGLIEARDQHDATRECERLVPA